MTEETAEVIVPREDLLSITDEFANCWASMKQAIKNATVIGQPGDIIRDGVSKDEDVGYIGYAKALDYALKLPISVEFNGEILQANSALLLMRLFRHLYANEKIATDEKKQILGRLLAKTSEYAQMEPNSKQALSYLPPILMNFETIPEDTALTDQSLIDMGKIRSSESPSDEIIWAVLSTKGAMTVTDDFRFVEAINTIRVQRDLPEVDRSTISNRPIRGKEVENWQVLALIGSRGEWVYHSEETDGLVWRMDPALSYIADGQAEAADSQPRLRQPIDQRAEAIDPGLLELGQYREANDIERKSLSIVFDEREQLVLNSETFAQRKNEVQAVVAYLTDIQVVLQEHRSVRASQNPKDSAYMLLQVLSPLMHLRQSRQIEKQTMMNVGHMLVKEYFPEKNEYITSTLSAIEPVS